MHKAFASVLPYVLDVKTLLVCSTLSQQSQQLVKDAVRLNLARLVKLIPDLARQLWPRDWQLEADIRGAQLLWLCKSAGHAAVNTYNNTCAILGVIGNMYIDEADKSAVLRLLHLTTKVLTHAAIHHQTILKEVVECCNCSQVDSIVKDIVTHITLRLYDGYDIDHQLALQIHALVEQATSANMPDVLRVLTAFSNTPRGPVLLTRALEYDMFSVRLLHPEPSDGLGCGLQGMAAASASTPVAEVGPLPWQQRQTPAAVLLRELLDIAVAASSVEAVHSLCAVPSTSNLGVPQVLQLIFSASRLPDEADHATLPCIMASLCSLPAAQALPAGGIAAVLYRGIGSSCSHRLLPLLELPNTKQIDTHGLCQLVTAAAAEDAYELAGALCRMAQGRRLDRRPLVQLIELFIDAHNRSETLFRLPENWNDIWEGLLADLQPGEHLTGDEVLHLLEFVTEKGASCWTVCWEPAASQVKDMPRLVRVLQDMACCEHAVSVDAIGQLVGRLPAVRHLGAADWFQVLSTTFHNAVTAGGTEVERCMPAGCVELAGVQRLNAQQVKELLRVCIQQRLHGDAATLLQLPLAVLMPTATIERLLKQLLHAVPANEPVTEDGQEGSCWVTLLRLPPAKEMAIKAVQQLHNTAIELGFAGMAKALLAALPVQAMSISAVTGPLLVQGLLAAIKRARKGGDLAFWAEEPGLQSLETKDCEQLVVALLELSRFSSVADAVGHAYDAEPLSMQVIEQLLGLLYAVLQVPACRHMQAQGVICIIEACLQHAWSADCIESLEHVAAEASQYGLEQGVQLFGWRWCHPHCALLALLVVTALPAASQINGSQLADLLHEASQAVPCVCVWKLLMQLPAAQRLLPAQMVAVLLQLLSSRFADDSMMCKAGPVVSLIAGLLLQHPVGQQLSVDEITCLLVYVVQQTPYTGMHAVARQLLQHPAGLQLSSDTLVHLVLITAWQPDRLFDICLQHPQAASMTAAHIHKLLELYPGHGRSPSAVPQLLQLPAAQQFTKEQMRSLLWQACQVGDKRMCESLSTFPSATAVMQEPVMQVALAAVEQCGGEDNAVRSWCSCPRCIQLQRL